MLMKLLVSAFERARSKLIVERSNDRIRSDSNIKINNIDLKSNGEISSSEIFIIQQQPRSSLSKWLCTTPASIDRSISSSRSNKVRRTSSSRSMKERTNNSISSRTLSVDELHRNNKQFQNIQRRHLSPSSMTGVSHCRQKLSNDTTSHIRFDRLSSTLVNYSDTKKKSQRRNNRKQFEQQIFSTLSHHSGGGDSGYSEESFVTKSFKHSLHTSCPHCHCIQHSSFNNYKKLQKNNSSTESSPSDIINKNEIKNLSNIDYYNKENLSISQSFPHMEILPKVNFQSKQKITRTLTDKRRRNLSCDGSLWMRTSTQKSMTLTSSPVFSEPNHLSLQRHFTTIDMKHCHPLTTYEKPNSNVFGELNLAAIELDSLRTSFSSSAYSSTSSSSSSSTSTNNGKYHRKQTYLVWHEYKNSSLLSTTNGTNIFSVIRGDQVRLLKRIGKSTLLVQKEDDGSIGFLPQSCLACHQINSFLSLKGLKETVL
ncbi:unnamed protein product [Rotaria sordida]|uniref:SH3 domain-containing protein n=1 Tax=Rotaria sordida TaxID=392033 RepID=A0A814DMI7_9BILA|nr:unnamed protein product [Rotaria sordida]CAF1097790.1 unnamed protein product [Rotaria sordida]